jgi:hypothetical protein
MGAAARPWRRLSDDERSVLLSELLLRHPELAAEAEEITSALLVVEREQELSDEITAKLRALRADTPWSADEDGDGAWVCSSRTLMTSPGEGNAVQAAALRATAHAFIVEHVPVESRVHRELTE